MYAYPVILTPLENGHIMAEFPDVPEALTYGETEQAALAWAADALQVALSGYMDARRDIPAPSAPAPGHPTVAPAPMVGIKLCLYQAMREQGLSQTALANRLHCDARQVRRLLDLDHQSTFTQLLDAADVLGFTMGVEMQRKETQRALVR